MRLVLDPPGPAAANMAQDEALLEEGRPTLRLYGWRPAAVSLGRAQGPEAVDADAVRDLGLDVVRRSTGGGAILHEEDEVTYAVVMPLADVPRDLAASFAYLSGGVVEALRTLGLAPDVASGPSRADEALCYLRHQGTNVFVRGRKVSGGAQRRTATAVLQHGTVIVSRDAARWARVFRAEAEDIRAKVTSLADEGVSVSREKLVEALVDGYARALGVRFDLA